MGWLGKIISKVKNTKYADVMTGQVPIFSQFGRDIYVSDVVQQAIECIANEIKDGHSIDRGSAESIKSNSSGQSDGTACGWNWSRGGGIGVICGSNQSSD